MIEVFVKIINDFKANINSSQIRNKKFEEFWFRSVGIVFIAYNNHRIFSNKFTALTKKRMKCYCNITNPKK